MERRDATTPGQGQHDENDSSVHSQSYKTGGQPQLGSRDSKRSRLSEAGARAGGLKSKGKYAQDGSRMEVIDE